MGTAYESQLFATRGAGQWDRVIELLGDDPAGARSLGMPSDQPGHAVQR
jgi:hypothetical protein